MKALSLNKKQLVKGERAIQSADDCSKDALSSIAQLCSFENRSAFFDKTIICSLVRFGGCGHGTVCSVPS